MDANYWLHAWQQGRTGFHRDAPLPWLQQYWPQLALPAGSRVLVPLCGKSTDMTWLAEQGYRVTGVELSPIAVHDYFAANHWQPTTHASAIGKHHVAGSVEIIEGNLFDVPASFMQDFDAVYDRAAMVALPQDMRQSYAQHVYGALPRYAKGLIATLEYDQDEMTGPPFAVDAPQLRQLLPASWDMTPLARQDVLASSPAFAQRGLTRFDTAIYRLQNHD